MGKRVWVACIAALFFSTAVFGDPKTDIDSLKGLDGVAVVVEDIEKGTGPADITPEVIRTAVELSLRKAGIRVNRNGVAKLYINANLMRIDPVDGLYSYAIRVSLIQPVQLPRDPNNTFDAETWAKAAVGASGALVLKKAVIDSAVEKAEQFENAYLEANPKK